MNGWGNWKGAAKVALLLPVMLTADLLGSFGWALLIGAVIGLFAPLAGVVAFIGVALVNVAGGRFPNTQELFSEAFDEE